MKAAVFGAGIFGLTSALALAERGHTVILYDPYPLQHERAASFDISKAIRGSYGHATAAYAPLVSEARERWRNLERVASRSMYHQCGGLHLALSSAPDGFELTSERELRKLGWPVSMRDPADCARLLPGFALHGIYGGVYDPWAGWLDPVAALTSLAEEAVRAGVELRVGVPVPDPASVPVDVRVLCMGAWLALQGSPWSELLRISRQHEGFFEVGIKDADLGRNWPFWSLDLDGQGFYGFPRQDSGLLKVSCHRPGPEASAESDRLLDGAASDSLRAWIKHRIPTAAGLPDLGRTCLYTLTRDHDWIIDAYPGRPGWFVAGAGSGHAFKFGSVLGRLTADLVLDGVRIPRFSADRAPGPSVS